MADKVWSVKKWQQTEMRVTRGSPRGILIADKEGRHKRGCHSQEGLGSAARQKQQGQGRCWLCPVLTADGACSKLHLDL